MIDKGTVIERWSSKRASAAAREVAKAAARQGRESLLPIERIGPPEVILAEGFDVRSVEFLKTYAWRTLRYRALKMANGRCECCGAGPQHGVRLNVDHILPRRERPDLALDLYNLQVLCDDCNAGKGNWDETDWR